LARYYFVPSIVGAVLLLFLLFVTTPMGTLESGVPANFGVALVTWVAFALSIFVLGYVLFDFAVEKRQDEMAKLGFTKARAGAVVLVAGLAVILYLQLGTPYFVAIESGILAGEVPLALTGVTSAVWLIVLGSILLRHQLRNITFANGLNPKEPAVTELPASDPVIAPPAPTQQSVQPQPSVPGPPIRLIMDSSSITLEDIRRVGTIMAQKDVEALTAHGSPAIGEADRDFLQIKKNVSEWIILSLSIGGKMPKQKLESSFEDQFPKKLLPLFNSVLYDLIYQNRVQSTRDGTKMMISLP